MENKVKLSGVVKFADRRTRGKLTVDTYFISVKDEKRKPKEDGTPYTFSVKCELLAPQKKDILFKKDKEVLITGRLFNNRWLDKSITDPKQAQAKDWHSETMVIIESIVDNSEPF